ncbi:MAG TPA: DUF4390 domain-containing protein [Syntrophales bacterium]|nr:DUF4390 domain-containing protein [Syntrophales bacterium]HPC01906.1 DUF4390 domain-containing protein [Syntrophales bacterium]HRS87802.1 DUF4390 domain-containing protein [Syntrophales bacterium]HRV43356.1 DUF4390 domain-containing protein [Syntrophales bacterium]
MSDPKELPMDGGVCPPARRQTFFYALLAVALTAAALAAVPAAARTAQMKDILVTPQAGSLVVYARVTDCFTREMEAAILAGVPTTFTLQVELYESRRLWFDEKISTASISNTVKYDSLKRLFYVSSPAWRERAVFFDLQAAKEAMSEFTGRILVPRDRIARGAAHYLMMKVKLDKIRLPAYLEYLFFFTSLWDFETVWYRYPVDL